MTSRSLRAPSVPPTSLSPTAPALATYQWSETSPEPLLRRSGRFKRSRSTEWEKSSDINEPPAKRIKSEESPDAISILENAVDKPLVARIKLEEEADVKPPMFTDHRQLHEPPAERIKLEEGPSPDMIPTESTDGHQPEPLEEEMAQGTRSVAGKIESLSQKIRNVQDLARALVDSTEVPHELGEADALLSQRRHAIIVLSDLLTASEHEKSEIIRKSREKEKRLTETLEGMEEKADVKETKRRLRQCKQHLKQARRNTNTARLTTLFALASALTAVLLS